KNQNPVKRIRQKRALYVGAALTVLLGYQSAEMPEQGTIPLPSFEDWSRRVRDALIWLGEDDPCETMQRLRSQDPKTRQLAEVLHQWHAVIGEHGVSGQRVIEYAAAISTDALAAGSFKNAEFREALLVVAGDRGNINSLRLGKWLSKQKGRIADGLRIE